MNLLVVDAGNSRLKWGWYRSGEWEEFGQLENQRVPGQLATIWSQHPIQPQQIWVVNSAGEARMKELQHYCQLCWREASLQQIRTRPAWAGLNNGYLQPEQLGVDRWVAMVAAWQCYQEAFCVVDCGTAVTLDFVDTSGMHQGGMIFPRAGESLAQLLQRVPHLRQGRPVGRHQGEVLLGDSTEQALRSHQGELAAAVAAAIGELRECYGHFRILVTGGGSDGVISRLTTASEYPRLVLDGALAIALGAKKTRKQQKSIDGR